MNKNVFKTIAILLITGLGVLLQGCATKPTQARVIKNVKVSMVTLKDVVDANNQFGFDLYSKQKTKAKNIFFSPYSVSSALSMAHEGARGKTAQEMRTVLNLPGDQERTRQTYALIYNQLNKSDKEYELNVANALWAQEKYPFADEYFSVIEKYYGGYASNLDFKNDVENSRLTINQWVQSQTNNRIKDLIPSGSLSEANRLVLTNAVYFKAKWLNQFVAENTENGPFKINTEVKKSVKMMHKTNDFNYGETDNLQTLEMDYLGGDLSMLIILPKEINPAAVESALSATKLDELRRTMKTEKVEVALPKFKMENKYFLGDDLKRMGMRTAFKYPEADFTKMSPTRELSIGEVIHQTFIEVNEKETEAAAATGAEMTVGSAISEQIKKPKVFKADHPFIFVIQQKDTGNILFMGRVSDPS